MLVLSRKKEQAIVIGGNITIRVAKLSGGMVKLGIDAPDDVTIHREEIHLQIHAPEEETNRHISEPEDAATSDQFPMGFPSAKPLGETG